MKTLLPLNYSKHKKKVYLPCILWGKNLTCLLTNHGWICCISLPTTTGKAVGGTGILGRTSPKYSRLAVSWGPSPGYKCDGYPSYMFVNSVLGYAEKAWNGISGFVVVTGGLELSNFGDGVLVFVPTSSSMENPSLGLTGIGLVTGCITGTGIMLWYGFPIWRWELKPEAFSFLKTRSSFRDTPNFFFLK